MIVTGKISYVSAQTIRIEDVKGIYHDIHLDQQTEEWIIKKYIQNSIVDVKIEDGRTAYIRSSKIVF